MTRLLGSGLLQPEVPPQKSITSNVSRPIADAPTLRQWVYDDALNALSGVQPMSNARHTLSLTKLRYADPGEYSYEEEKDAILRGKTLARRLRGTWVLADADGQVLGRKNQTLANIPHVTDRGTFIHRGNEYTLNNQQRLRSGIFTRIKDNGEIEAHVNILPGEGTAHRYFLDPEKGVFYVRIRQAKIPLMPLLRVLGATDGRLRNAWGPELLASNYKYDQPAALKKLYDRLVPARSRKAGEMDVPGTLRAVLEGTALDPKITSQTLGRPHKNLSLDAILDTTKKLLAVSRGEADVDDRDSLAFQTFHGPEDLISERLAKDWGGIRRKLLQRVSFKGSLDVIPTNALNKQVEAAILHSGLGQHLEEINPSDVFDKQWRISRLGEGGIPSIDAIPDECFDSKTEVFTRRGWVAWPNITMADELACLIGGRLEFCVPTRLVCQEFSGELYRVKTRTLDHVATPNHRMWCRKYRSNSSIQRCGQASWEFELVKNGYRKPREFQVAHEAYAGKDTRRRFKLPVVQGARKKYEFDFNDWAELVGWYVTEGSIDQYAKQHRSKYQITLTQSLDANPENVQRIHKLLERLGIRYSFQSRRNFVFVSKQIGCWLEGCGTYAPNKQLPEECQEWPVSARRRLLESLILGDGSCKPNGAQTFGSSSQVLVSQIARLAVCLGHAVRERKPNDTPRIRPGKIRGREVRAKHGWYTCAILLSKTQGITSERMYAKAYSKIDYKGKVFCASVPGERVLVRRNRSVGMWSGNSRSVQPSHFGYIDPLRTPESFKTGVDLFLARSVRKGRDGKIYAPFINTKSGKTVYRSPQDVANMAIAFPGKHLGTLANPLDGKWAVAMYKGRPRYMPVEDISLAMPSFENAMSPLGNMIPMKSAVKGQRAVMAARMLTQAVPLIEPEAPLVQSGNPEGTRSFEDEYGSHMGAVRATAPGIVVGVGPSSIAIRAKNGETKNVQLYNNFPYNRKTYLHQTPVVSVGQPIKEGDLIARSNYTDKRGQTALGQNLRVAYVPFRGMNFEDAIVISEGAAKRLTSEHMYQHKVDWAEDDRRGRSDFVALFPDKLDRRQLETIEQNGVARTGTVLQYDDPIILAATPRAAGHHKVHKRGAKSFADTTVRWNHHSPGVITDVVDADEGTTVLVKAVMPMQVGDKLSGRYGDKGIVSAIVPDDQMPHDKDGRPFEALLNPLGVISRTNPAQLVEAALGRLAEANGEPIAVPDFDDIEDIAKWALTQLRRAGLSDLEAVVDPETDRKIPDIFVGNRFFMKLHHTAEGKGQGRGATGGHTQEGTPAKGGETGAKRLSLLNTNALLSHGACFMGSVNVLTETGPLEISKIVRKRLSVKVACANTTSGKIEYQPVIDWLCRCVPPEELLTITTTARTGDGSRAAHQKIRCTRGHEFYTPNGKTQAAYLKPGDRLLSPGTKVLPWQEQLLLGGLMGDGYITKRKSGAGGFAVCHGHKQWHYLNWKFELLQNLGAAVPKRQKLSSGSFAKKPTGRFTLRQHAVTTAMQQEFYPAGKKIAPKGIVKRMGWFGIGVWFGDDGGCVVTNSTGKISAVRFHTNAFTVEEVDRLAAELRDFTGLPWRRYLQDGKYPILTLGNGDGKQNNKGDDNTTKFLNQLQPYLPPGLGHKIRRSSCGRAWRKGLKPPAGVWLEEVTVKTVLPYRPAKHEDCLVYNITVAKQRNYIVHGILVGNTQVLRDASLIRGQRNEDYWLAYMKGLDPPDPKIPVVYEKFVNQLRGAGINVVSDGGQLHVMALTDSDVDRLAGRREVTRGDTVRFEKELEPVRNGLFDPRLTGGHHGGRWAAIKLAEPMPNPVMEDPIRHMLGLTKAQFRSVLAGREKVGDFTGPAGIRRALSNINVKQAIEQARADIASGRKGLRDAAIRKLGYLKAAERYGIHPQEWMLRRAPVLPPQFRPISMMEQGGVPLVADANYLYKELLDANDTLRTMQTEVEDVGDERLALYDAFRSVSGLGSPIHPKLQEKRVRGLLSHVFGSSPKLGTVQKRLIGSSVNLVGRAVISPNPDLDMDTVGIPESKAWDVYKIFVIRRLRRRGLPVAEAIEHVKNKTPLARQEILNEMAERPVFIDRAPVLHRFGIMAAWPVLAKGDVLQVSPLVVGGFGADFDGDAMQYHVPVDELARKEAIELMMPSKNLLSPADFKSPVHKPSQEYVGGLFAATRRPSSKKRTHYFSSKKEAVEAYRRGDIAIDTPVEVLA